MFRGPRPDLQFRRNLAQLVPRSRRQVVSINVLTEDTHARRTWMLFKEALGPGVQVGIISASNPDYDAKHWWRSSEGVREVIDESVAYVYAKFFFWPAKEQD